MTSSRLKSMGLAMACLAVTGACRAETPPAEPGAAESIELPPPRTEGVLSVEAAIAARRSVRAFTAQPLTMEEVGQLLWSAQGITDRRGLRAAPSAGATYPLELYVLLPDGAYRYLPAGHRLVRVLADDRREAVRAAALGQDALRAPAVFVFTAVQARTARRYGARARRYIDMEIGHAAQNLSLQAIALGLGSVMIGAMDDAQVQKVLGLPRDHEVLYLVPVGRAP